MELSVASVAYTGMTVFIKSEAASKNAIRLVCLLVIEHHSFQNLGIEKRG